MRSCSAPKLSYFGEAFGQAQQAELAQLEQALEHGFIFKDNGPAAEAGRKAGTMAGGLTIAGGAIAGPLGAASVGAEQVGTGILDASGQEIMREVTRLGPSLGRQALAATARWVAQNPGKAAVAYQLARHHPAAEYIEVGYQ